jgi:signal transduction histidine kinase
VALDELGLEPALRALVSDWGETEPAVALALETEGAFSRLSPEQSLALYRTAQEALTNIFRHANAKSARVRVECGASGARALIEDDGAGFKADIAPGLGLAGMRQRLAALGGSLEIGAAPGGGARIDARLPL